ncbi:MAG: hypothetical protein HOP19_05270 [Acidobacteria bacterium]|nr:hypothetical protein [Acidobacteriota bacterium]
MAFAHRLTRYFFALALLLFILPVAARAADPDVDLTITKSGPATITAGNDITYSIVVTGVLAAGAGPVLNATMTDTLPAGWTVVTVTTTQGSCAGVGTGTANCTLGSVSLTIPVTITLTAHVPGLCQPATAVNTATVAGDGAAFTGNNTSPPVVTTVTQPILGPGQCYPPGSSVSTTKPGSILIFPFYASSPTSSNDTNTRVSMTNTHPTRGIAMHLFFIDGATCSVADSYACLTANQTVTFLMSDVDPGTSGYIVAVASSGPDNFGEGQNTGCPISFNFLIGHQSIKLPVSSTGTIGNTVLARTRVQTELEAESVAAEFGSPVPGCDPSSPTAVLRFNGQPDGYNRLPRVLAASSIASRADGNSTFLVVNRVGGDLSSGAATLGSLFGFLFDDAETSYSFTLAAPTCQLRGTLSGTFPRTTPRIDTIISSGRTGWMKIWGTTDIGITGAIINNNVNVDSAASAFDGGHKLHKLTFTSSAVLTVPVFPPSC